MATAPVLRWMTTDDIPRVAGIDKHYPHAWDYKSFQKAKKSPYAMIAVIERDNFVVGYVGFVVGVPAKQADGSTRIDVALIKMAVDPDYLRQGLGRCMVAAVERYALNRRSSGVGSHGSLYMAAMVRETNLTAQIFLRGIGFKATRVKRASFDDEDGYDMVRAANWNTEGSVTVSARPAGA